MVGGEFTIRPATGDDREGILELALRTLGWRGDERDRAFFTWKHDRNPFGPSPAWVATRNDRISGYRALLRWEFHRGAATLRLARAVDTATDPRDQGKGIFRQLTLGAVEHLTTLGFDAVFNTPNDRSLPGYLKMGWSQLGRPSLGARPRGLVAGARMVRHRAAADMWSHQTAVGDPVADVLFDPRLQRLLQTLPRKPGWATPLTPGYLRWRYGFEPLHYRSMEVRDGLAIFRVRRRGRNLEVALCEWLSARPDQRAVSRLARGGSYVVAVGLGTRHGLVPLPRQGPIVTWRSLGLSPIPRLSDLDLHLGDLELF